jgi:hypothetical protein
VFGSELLNNLPRGKLRVTLPNRTDADSRSSVPIQPPANLSLGGAPLRSCPPRDSYESQHPGHADRVLGLQHVHDLLRGAIGARLQDVVYELLQYLPGHTIRLVSQLKPHRDVGDIAGLPATAHRGWDLQCVEFLAGASKRDRFAMKSRLAERPFDMNSVRFRPFHRGFAQRRGGSCLEPSSKAFGAHEGMASAQSSPILGARERGLDTLGNHLPLLLGKRRIDVDREGVAVSAKRGNHEMHLVLHEPSNKVHVARQPVEPRDNEWPTRSACLLKRYCEARSQQERVFSRACLDILMP